MAKAETGSNEKVRLLAGGLASYLSAQVLAGKAEALPGCRELLLTYLLAPSLSATPRSAG